MKLGAATAGLAVFLAGAAPAGAQTAVSDDGEARALFERGSELAGQERWGEALEYFRRALARADRPAIVLNIGICLFTLGRHVEAASALQQFLGRAGDDADPEEVRQARQMLSQSRAAIATLVLRVSPESAAVSVDGRPRPGSGTVRTILLDPGEHVIRLSAPGYLAGNGRISVLPGQRVEQAIDLARLAEQPATPRERPSGGGILSSPIFWVVAGAVVVGLGIGIGLALYEPGTESPIEGNVSPYVLTTAWSGP